MDSTEQPAQAVPAPSIQDGVIQKALALLVTIGFFGAIAFMLIYPLPPEGHDALLIMVGALGSGWIGILNYYFGSSLGSAIKTAMAKGS